MKLVVVAIAVLLLVWLLGSARRRGNNDRRDASAVPPPKSVEGMVACTHCGVHVPASLAVLSHGQGYCCAAHRDAGPRAP